MTEAIRVLIVEDLPTDAELNEREVSCVLPESEFQRVESREDFLTALESFRPDIILSDYKLPYFDGLTALKLSQERAPEVPFIIVTGSMNEDTAVECMKAGAWDYVIKEHLKRLGPAVLNGLEQKRLRRGRRLTLEALRESEEKFRRLSQEFHGLLDAIPDSLMLLDKELKVLWANRAAAENLGATHEAVTGRFCYDLWYKRTTPCEPCPVALSFETGKPRNEIVSRPDGRIWDVRTVPLSDERGRITNVIEVKRDITEHRKLEAQYLQAQKMESIGTLAGGIAHDFNNILSTIIGYGHVALMKMAEDEPQRLNIENMLEGADRAAHLTKDLLLFSRKQISERKLVDLNEVVGHVEKFLKRVIGEDIVCKKSATERPLTVFADSHQLEQVLMNLATNARDAMPGGGAFTVTTEQINLNEDFTSAHGYGKPGPYAMIIISDTGSGMDEETRKRIFEPFFTTKEVGKGTGLGLAVVYGIIKQHEGFINVYSEPGKGATFRIYLPLFAPAAREELAARQEEAPVRGTETVLVAEDDEALRKLSRIVLSEYGYTVIDAVDGEDAVRKFMENRDKIHVLLFDLIMPKMNGKEAYEAIRKIKPDMKVIFSSGYAPDIIRQMASLEDGAYIINKPISPYKLLRKVRSVLDETIYRIAGADAG